MIKLNMKNFNTTLIESGEEILPSNKQQIIEQAYNKLYLFSFRKSF